MAKDENTNTINELYESACRAAGQSPEQLNGSTKWEPASTIEGLINQGREVTIPSRIEVQGEDVTGLQESILYGLKGTAAYMEHAAVLGQEDPAAYATVHEAIDFLTRENPSVDDLVGWAMKIGELNLKVMELLDAANTGVYGQPEPTEVRTTPIKGKAILVSGHDLKDLGELLKQTEGKGINVYTHGEMLPCLAYPELKKYKHLAGHYGGAWQDQKREFSEFPGPILMTTNCIVQPVPVYKDRIYTTGLVRWPGVRHIGPDKDAYSAIKVASALAQAFDCGVNDLPLSMILSWFEQKAVAILLTLLYLGIKDMRLGPKLLVFITPAVLNVLVDKFNIQPIGDVEADLQACLA